VLLKHHQFVRDEDEDDGEAPSLGMLGVGPVSGTSAAGAAGAAGGGWEKRVAREYYHTQLYKEFALCDLSDAARGRIALRWRTASEVGTVLEQCTTVPPERSTEPHIAWHATPTNNTNTNADITFLPSLPSTPILLLPRSRVALGS